jgi:hypothetical protein
LECARDAGSGRAAITRWGAAVALWGAAVTREGEDRGSREQAEAAGE